MHTPDGNLFDLFDLFDHYDRKARYERSMAFYSVFGAAAGWIKARLSPSEAHSGNHQTAD